MADTLVPTPANAAATLIALLSEPAPDPRPMQTELLRVLALVHGFLRKQSPEALNDPERWLGALNHVPFTGPASTTSMRIQDVRAVDQFTAQAEQALRGGRAQLGTEPDLPRFLRTAASFLEAPPAPGGRHLLTLVSALAPAAEDGKAAVILTVLELHAAPNGNGCELCVRRNELLLNTNALSSPDLRGEWEELLQGVDVEAVRRLPNFTSIVVAPEPPPLP